MYKMLRFRQFSNRLVDEVVRPLQRLISTRDTIRKQVIILNYFFI